MRMLAVFGILAVVTITFIWLLLSYANNIGNVSPEDKQKNRSPYLLDTRWPFVNFQFFQAK